MGRGSVWHHEEGWNDCRYIYDIRGYVKEWRVEIKKVEIIEAQW